MSNKTVEHEKHCECSYCGKKFDIEVPKHLMDQLASNSLVIFAGAGISTEGSNVHPETLYDLIRKELNIDDNISFPDLMTRYCNLPDGRIKLLRTIYNRFEYIKSYSELYRAATQFHKELSTIPHIQNIITTNWDDFFEIECDAIPFSNPSDYIFWDVGHRRVFKLHGSISNFGSLVITRENYVESLKELTNGIIGSNLKLFLSTKTILYAGYSLQDSDFVDIHSEIRNQLGNLMPQAYIVNPYDEDVDRYNSMGIVHLKTDAAHLLHLIKKELELHDNYIAPIERKIVIRILNYIASIQKRIFENYKIQSNPDTLFSYSFLDGLRHGFDRYLRKQQTSQYNCPGCMESRLGLLASAIDECIQLDKYGTASYLIGYAQATEMLSEPGKIKKLKLKDISTCIWYISKKITLLTYDEYVEYKKTKKRFLKKAAEAAKKYIANSVGDSNNFVPHHIPWNLQVVAPSIDSVRDLI